MINLRLAKSSLEMKGMRKNLMTLMTTSWTKQVIRTRFTKTKINYSERASFLILKSPTIFPRTHNPNQPPRKCLWIRNLEILKEKWLHCSQNSQSSMSLTFQQRWLAQTIRCLSPLQFRYRRTVTWFSPIWIQLKLRRWQWPSRNSRL